MATPVELVKEVIDQMEELQGTLSALERHKQLNDHQNHVVAMASDSLAVWKHTNLKTVKLVFGIEE